MKKLRYTKYDRLGRTVETGEAIMHKGLGQMNPAHYTGIATWPDRGRRYYTVTVYSTPMATVHYLGHIDSSQQRYLRNRVSYTYNHDSVHTFYSYDPHGNVEWMVSDLPGLGRNYVRYEYDLTSDRALALLYNAGLRDQFHHRYGYDEDGRLLRVETSRDGVLWDRDAVYGYYAHGPLRTVRLGEDRLQKIDHVYTIQGWLKGINDPAHDPGNDADADGGANSRYAPDGYPMALGYYAGDYLRKHGGAHSALNSATSGPGGSYTAGGATLVGID